MVTETNNDRSRFTGNGQGNLNTVLGAIGTAGAIGLFNGGLGGIFGGPRPPMEPPATQRDLKYERELTTKDAEIGQLKAEKYADSAVLAAERRLADKIEKIETTMTAGFRAQGEYNVANTAAVASLNNQTQQLMKMTNLIIAAPAFAESQAAASVFTGKAASASAQAA